MQNLKPLGTKTKSDLGLLVLRGYALLLLVIYGWNKLTWLYPLFRGDQAWASWGFAVQIGKLGFPVPVLLAVFVVFCESVGALFIAIGFCTRFFAGLTALSMCGALYFSLKMGEGAWQLAVLYLLAFVTLAFIGSGRFSIDRVIQTRRKSPESVPNSIQDPC